MSLFAKLIRIPLIALLLVTAVSGLVVTPAFADGETPPPPDGGAVTEEAAPESQVSESAAVESSESETPETIVETPAEILEQVPEGTDVVVVNEEGEPLPLASQEAAATIVYGDPIWCPAGTAPIAMTGGCSASYTTMAGLLAGAVPTGNGTIWVQYGASSAGVNIDGSGSWSSAHNYNLTIQGGWNGVSGSTALNSSNPYSTFVGANADWLWITNWTGNVTLNNLIFDASTYDYVQTSDFEVLQVETANNITLNNVQVDGGFNSSATGEHDGALLDNSSGNGSITVNNSSFTNNEGVGLTALSDNTVTLSNVQANNNGENGANLDNSTSSSAKPVNVTNSQFSGNGGQGLNVDSKGAVTLTGVAADNNASDGVSINNSQSSQGKTVMLGGSNHFNGNGDHGLEVISNGVVTLNNVTASSNGLDGVYIDNVGAVLSTSSCYGVPVAVSVTGTNLFQGNGLTGLTILTSGEVTLNNVSAVANGTDGVLVDNTSGDDVNANNYGWGWGYSSTSNPSISVTGTNLFNGNGSSGLVVLSAGSVSLNNLTATYNGLDGVYVENTLGAGSSGGSCGGSSSAGVSLTGRNTLNGNGFSGLTVLSAGSVSMNNVTANFNGTDGVYVDNTFGPISYYGSSNSSVTMTGTNSFSGNGLSGIMVMSEGAVTMS
ncbi:MAG TPA: right-handed parallel beta-helix repeat-containing protein, partial [Terriglobales bacterium]|nr:right-handed parallel beta-helix repeat-containing protein [Terriglobales bacterium]